jgi:hypothetical protein
MSANKSGSPELSAGERGFCSPIQHTGECEDVVFIMAKAGSCRGLLSALRHLCPTCRQLFTDLLTREHDAKD